MAKTVDTAFQSFNKDAVNLEKSKTDTARSSRDWLVKQLNSLPNKEDRFPELYEGKHIKFGSFARNTKIRPLDDIDLILALKACGATYLTIEHGKQYTISVPETATNLKLLCNENGTLNSIKVVNKIVTSLKKIEKYSSADIHRRQEAATLKLSSYEWNFDIVPSFYTDTGYYLIPDGSGNWKASDPRIDQERVATINQKFDGTILQIIRTLKYWNQRNSATTIPSYLFESIILNYFAGRDSISNYIDANLINFWAHLNSSIFDNVNDPKGFQGDLNTLSQEEKSSISGKAKATYEKGLQAWKYETEEKNQEKSINKWREIFGDDFPKYE